LHSFAQHFLRGTVWAATKSGLSFALIALIWAGLTWVILIEARCRSGFDGIDYVLVIVGVNGPIGAGMLIGGLFGWFRESE
jgi:hypothetical protein